MGARAPLVALTGGIGSGKSTVAALLAETGATVIDADVIARACTAAGGAAMPLIRAHFGPRYITATGALDRATMRALVFREPTARAQLEALVHPLVEEEIRRRVAAARSLKPPFVVLDIPLLVEHLARWRKTLDHILVVDCDAETQRARVAARDHLAADEIQRILAAQASRAQRLAMADSVIFNGAGVDLEQLRQRVLDFVAKLQSYHGAE